MTIQMLRMAAYLCEDLKHDTIMDFREFGSEGAVLRMVVPGPIRGPGSYLIARNGDAQEWETGNIIRYAEIKVNISIGL